MKYNANAYSPYPVLRPHSSDFPEGQISTTLKHFRKNDVLEMEVEFDVSEGSLSRHIEKGDAICSAMVYCTATCYSQMLTANKGEKAIYSSVPLHLLYGRVEIHPSIIADYDLVLRTETAHSEYGKAPIPVNRGMRLAMDEPYHFLIGYLPAIESVFRLEQDDTGELSDWEFDFISNLSDRYITIRANSETYQIFQSIRSKVPLTAATVYLNALTTALAVLSRDQGEPEPADGWAASIRTHLENQQINLEHMELGLAAQKLLKTPLSYLKEAM